MMSWWQSMAARPCWMASIQCCRYLRRLLWHQNYFCHPGELVSVDAEEQIVAAPLSLRSHLPQVPVRHGPIFARPANPPLVGACACYYVPISVCWAMRHARLVSIWIENCCHRCRQQQPILMETSHLEYWNASFFRSSPPTLAECIWRGCTKSRWATFVLDDN